MNDFVLSGSSGIWFGIFQHFDRLGITHAISTRMGGVSQGAFDSMNLALHTGDVPKDVIENRRKFCKVLGLNFSRLVTAQQVHGDVVAKVSECDIGRGREHYEDALCNTDALITNLSNIPLMLFFADCVPVLIADPVHQAIGVSHAGWKGTVAKIAQKTILAMQKEYGTNPADCLVGIGPSVGSCCYEVDDVVVSRLKEEFPRWQELVKPHQKRWLLDLWEANRMQLEDIGVLHDNILISGVCTSCNSKLFYSYRADKGHTGRICAVICL